MKYSIKIFYKFYLIFVLFCTFREHLHLIELRTGATKFFETGEQHVIDDFIIHENFNRTDFDNDIGLIKV